MKDETIGGLLAFVIVLGVLGCFAAMFFWWDSLPTGCIKTSNCEGTIFDGHGYSLLRWITALFILTEAIFVIGICCVKHDSKRSSFGEFVIWAKFLSLFAAFIIIFIGPPLVYTFGLILREILRVFSIEVFKTMGWYFIVLMIGAGIVMGYYGVNYFIAKLLNTPVRGKRR